MSEEWKALIRRFKPEDRPICNCGDAYYTLFPASSRKCLQGDKYVDHWGCEYGCSSAQLQAQDHVAKCVLAVLPVDPHKPEVGA